MFWFNFSVFFSFKKKNKSLLIIFYRNSTFQNFFIEIVNFTLKSTQLKFYKIRFRKLEIFYLENRKYHVKGGSWIMQTIKKLSSIFETGNNNNKCFGLKT